MPHCGDRNAAYLINILRITRIRFEGLGRRYAPISAGLRQRPLELSSFIIGF